MDRFYRGFVAGVVGGLAMNVKSDQGYVTVVDGIKRKTLVHGPKP